jgi:hypothetical protein
MPENRFPWRDIYSVEAWKKILEITKNSANQDLSQLTKLIERYHGIQKDRLDALAARRESLQKVEDESWRLIEDKKMSTDKDDKKKFDSRRGYITELGPWLASLAGRCWKKIDYLVTIEEFEKENRNSEYCRSAASYLRYLNKVQQRRAKDTNMHLTTGNRMERLDPLHRGGAELELFGDNYIQSTSNPLSRALFDWLDADSTTPFFLWLEYHPICVANPGLDKAWDETLRTVKKTLYPANADEVFVVTVLPGCLKSVSADPVSGRTEKTFDTSDARIVKGAVTAHGQYAFAWSTENQIYSAPHKAGTLHHSSFTHGYKVKAAGMWGVSPEGKVIYVDDNTGHYHTDAYHLYDFIVFLDKNRVLDPNAVVLARTLPGDNAWPVKRFLDQYRDPAIRIKELKANIKTSPLKVPGKGIGAPPPPTAAAAVDPGQKDLFSKMAAFKPPTVKKKDQ